MKKDQKSNTKRFKKGKVFKKYWKKNVRIKKTFFDFFIVFVSLQWDQKYIIKGQQFVFQERNKSTQQKVYHKA